MSAKASSPESVFRAFVKKVISVPKKEIEKREKVWKKARKTE